MALCVMSLGVHTKMTCLWYTSRMHLKGIRFGLPLMKRLGLLKHHETYRVSWNRHPGVEIHYVLKGDIAWELRGKDRPLAISGGFFGIVPANARHRALDSKGTPAVRLGVIFEKPAPELADGTPFSPDDLKRIFKRLRENGGAVRRFSPRLSSTLHALTDSLSLENATTPDGQLQLRMLASELLYETFATLGEPESLADGHDVVPQIRKWIEKHFAEKITIPRLVKLSGYGRSRFFSLFFAETGMTPNDYLVRIRIEKAKKKLAKPSLEDSLLNIAIACGFNSAAAFSSTFRKHVGVSPREFRAQASALE